MVALIRMNRLGIFTYAVEEKDKGLDIIDQMTFIQGFPNLRNAAIAGALPKDTVASIFGIVSDGTIFRYEHRRVEIGDSIPANSVISHVDNGIFYESIDILRTGIDLIATKGLPVNNGSAGHREADLRMEFREPPNWVIASSEFQTTEVAFAPNNSALLELNPDAPDLFLVGTPSVPVKSKYRKWKIPYDKEPAAGIAERHTFIVTDTGQIFRVTYVRGELWLGEVIYPGLDPQDASIKIFLDGLLQNEYIDNYDTVLLRRSVRGVAVLKNVHILGDSSELLADNWENASISVCADPEDDNEDEEVTHGG